MSNQKGIYALALEVANAVSSHQLLLVTKSYNTQETAWPLLTQIDLTALLFTICLNPCLVLTTLLIAICRTWPYYSLAVPPGYSLYTKSFSVLSHPLWGDFESCNLLPACSKELQRPLSLLAHLYHQELYKDQLVFRLPDTCLCTKECIQSSFGAQIICPYKKENKKEVHIRVSDTGAMIKGESCNSLVKIQDQLNQHMWKKQSSRLQELVNLFKMYWQNIASLT